jgi:MFS family permease
VSGWPLVASVLVFVGAFAMAMGPVAWIVNSEIFPTRLRGRAISISITVLWLTNWFVTQTFPWVLEHLGTATTFGAFAALSFISVIFVLRKVTDRGEPRTVRSCLLGNRCACSARRRGRD